MVNTCEKPLTSAAFFIFITDEAGDNHETDASYDEYGDEEMQKRKEIKQHNSYSDKK